MLMLIFNLNHVSIFSKLYGNNCSLFRKFCNLTKKVLLWEDFGKIGAIEIRCPPFQPGKLLPGGCEFPEHNIFIRWGFVLLGRRATKQQGKKKSYLKNPPFFLLKNGLRLWHEDMLWVSQTGWEAELLEGLKKRKSSCLLGAYALLLGQLFLSDQARWLDRISRSRRSAFCQGRGSRSLA